MTDRSAPPSVMETPYIHQLHAVPREHAGRDMVVVTVMWVCLFGLLVWLLGAFPIAQHLAR